MWAEPQIFSSWRGYRVDLRTRCGDAANSATSVRVRVLSSWVVSMTGMAAPHSILCLFIAPWPPHRSAASSSANRSSMRATPRTPARSSNSPSSDRTVRIAAISTCAIWELCRPAASTRSPLVREQQRASALLRSSSHRMRRARTPKASSTMTRRTMSRRVRSANA